MPYKAFDKYDYDDAKQLFQPQVPSTAGVMYYPADYSATQTKKRRDACAVAATAFYDGDHWQNEKGFIGEMPPLSVDGALSIKAKIKAGFVSENVIKEVVKTHSGGILGREPIWSFLPREGLRPNTKPEPDKETGDTLTAWWNERTALVDMQKAIRIALLEGISVRRIFIPRGRVPDTNAITAPDINSALSYIYFETLHSDRAGVFTDPDTQRDIGVYFFDEHNSKGEVTNQCAELSFLNDQGETVCRIVKDKGDPSDYGPYSLGGRLLIFQLNRDALITDQVQSSQRSLNLAHTMMMRNVNMAGSRGMNVASAQPPIEQARVFDSDTEVSRTITRPGKVTTGAGAVNFFMGWPIYDKEGHIVDYTDPNVTYVEPVPVDSFRDTIAEEKHAIYSQCHQRHVLIVDKADTSGRAREVARREFERSLKESKTVLDACGRWQLETSLYLAAEFANRSSRYLKLRADFNCLLDAGDPDPEKQKAALLLREPGGLRQQPLISDETARGWAGVEDAAAEQVKIDNEAKRPPAEPTPPVDGQTNDVDQTQSLVQ